MLKTMLVMDMMDGSPSRGDTPVAFDTEDKAATAKARALFDRLTGKGAAVFTISGDERKVTRFEDLAEENVVVPVIVGG